MWSTLVNYSTYNFSVYFSRSLNFNKIYCPTETKNLIEIQNNDSSLIVLDVRENRVLLIRSSLTEPPRLVMGRFNPSAEATKLSNLNLLEITKPVVMPEAIENLIIENVDYKYNSDEEVGE